MHQSRFAKIFYVSLSISVRSARIIPLVNSLDFSESFACRYFCKISKRFCLIFSEKVRFFFLRNLKRIRSISLKINLLSTKIFLIIKSKILRIRFYFVEINFGFIKCLKSSSFLLLEPTKPNLNGLFRR